MALKSNTTSGDGSVITKVIDINEERALGQELAMLEGIHGQNPETGAGVGSKGSYLGEYTNRVFGAPFQLLDSVDRRFPSINKYVGNEYLRNFLLNSPILTIKPGMPKYTGGDKGFGEKLGSTMTNAYFGSQNKKMSSVQSMILDLSKGTLFGGGSKLQRRMFGFRETYYDYMQHVNYMCRSVATYMSLTSTTRFPNGMFVSTSESGKSNFMEFSSADWSKYRMLSTSAATTPWEQMQNIVGAVGKTVSNPIGVGLAKFTDLLGNMFTGGNGIHKWYNENFGNEDGSVTSDSMFVDVTNSSMGLSAWDKMLNESWEEGTSKGILGGSFMSDMIQNKAVCVQFMVEPIQFSESLSNQTKSSAVESAVDGLNAIGSEVAFITGSNADFGAIGDLMNFIGSTTETAMTQLNGLVSNVTGGFLSNVFSGAMQSIKGQKMIYPEIYDRSNSTMDYEFDITLTTPYGDIYNYYMNIVVPLLHLIALASPRMVTSNTTTSPYLVQAYIPGMCTCQLGIVDSLQITKNPTQKHVSVNGFPLTVKVHMKIKELYNAMAISPANDPASFLFNETLNDYLSNLAGLAPSIDTYTEQRKNAFENLGEYIDGGGWKSDFVSGVVENIENMYYPYA